MCSIKTGLASVTFRNKSIEEIVSLCKNAGVGYIEWGADIHVKTADDAKKAKKLCDEAGIIIPSYGSYYRVGSGNEAEWLTLCENARLMGARSIRVWLGEKNSEDTSEKEYTNLLADLRKICEKAAEYGLLVCPECHDYTFNNETSAFLKISRELNMANFKTYFQSRYFRMAYDLDRIERTFSFIENIHISYSDLKKEQADKEKNEDYIDILLNRFKEKNFNGIVFIEFTENAEEKSFLQDVENLRKIL